MKDAIGQPLEIGDLVVFTPPYSTYLELGTIVKFTPANVRITPTEKASWVDDKGVLRDPNCVTKVTQQYKHFSTEYPEMLV